MTHEFNLGFDNCSGGSSGDWGSGNGGVDVADVVVCWCDGVAEVVVGNVVVGEDWGGNVGVGQVVVSQVVVGECWGCGVSGGSGGISVLVNGNWGSSVGDNLGGGSDQLLVDVGLSGDLFMDVGLSSDFLMDVGLSFEFLMDVGLSSDFLMDVGLSSGFFVDVGFSKRVDLSGVIVGVDLEDLLGSISNGLCGIGNGLGSISNLLGGVGKGLGSGGVSQRLGSVVQGIGGSSNELLGSWGGRGGQEARENSNLEMKKMF